MSLFRRFAAILRAHSFGRSWCPHRTSKARTAAAVLSRPCGGRKFLSAATASGGRLTPHTKSANRCSGSVPSLRGTEVPIYSTYNPEIFRSRPCGGREVLSAFLFFGKKKRLRKEKKLWDLGLGVRGPSGCSDKKGSSRTIGSFLRTLLVCNPIQPDAARVRARGRAAESVSAGRNRGKLGVISQRVPEVAAVSSA